MERFFRDLKTSEVRIVSPNFVELKAEDGWVITEADKSLQTESVVIYLPNEKYIKNYICVNCIEPEIEDIDIISTDIINEPNV